jgi:hypothetical protein
MLKVKQSLIIKLLLKLLMTFFVAIAENVKRQSENNLINDVICFLLGVSPASEC